MSNIPVIELRKNERIWMDSIYKYYFDGKKINYRELRAILYPQLPSNFNAENIDRRLITHNAEKPTLLGVIAVEGNDKIVDECDKVILGIKTILLEDPNRETITSEELAAKSGIAKERIQLLIGLILYYGNFFSSASMTQDAIGYDTLTIGKDDKIYDYYLQFESFRKVLEEYFLEELERKQRQNSYVEEDFFRTETEPQKEPVTNPYLKSTVSSTNKNLCFVIMPFTESWSENVFFDCIRPNIESMGLQCTRADNLRGPIIIDDVWIQINQAAFIIADVTNRNPNVMYELGIAHAIGKPVILLTQDIETIPFDFKHLRHHEYSNALGGNKFFENDFKEIVRSIYVSNYPSFAEKLTI